MCAHVLVHAIANVGCRDTVRESALKIDSGRKIPCVAPGNQTCVNRSDALRTELHPRPAECDRLFLSANHETLHLQAKVHTVLFRFSLTF